MPVEPDAPMEAKARVIDVGLGRIVGRRGEVLLEAVADMILGSWMPPGLAEPYDPADPEGETDRLGASPCSRIGEGIVAWRTGEWPLFEDPDDMEVVRLRRLLPWLSWW